MENYTQAWTQFEIHSLAFSVLRKHLYPAFLIRGDFKLEGCRADIAIFKPQFNKPPILKVIIEVKQSDDAEPTKAIQDYAEQHGVAYVLIAGLKKAYKSLEMVQDSLYK